MHVAFDSNLHKSENCFAILVINFKKYALFNENETLSNRNKKNVDYYGVF